MAVLAGEAAIRIVPTLRNFKVTADAELRAIRLDPVKVKIDPQTAAATARLASWRKIQEANAINIPVKVDNRSLSEFKRELITVEHIFKRNAFQRGLRLNVKVLGLDALTALAYASGSAAAGIDSLAKAAFALPGILGGALASVGGLAVGLRGISDAFQSMGDHAEEAASRTRDNVSANRDLERSYRNYRSAVKDTIRAIEDLNAENRRSSLNVADAILSVQESAQRLREGGQKSIIELRRDQLRYMQDLDRLQEVQRQSARVAEDTIEANANGVSNAPAVVDALDQITAATERLNSTMDSTSLTAWEKAMQKLSPNAQAAMNAVKGFEGAWKSLTMNVQDTLFQDLDRVITDLGTKSLPGLEVGLSRVASGLNQNFRSVADSLGSNTNQSFFSQIFGNTETGLKRLSNAIDPLTTGLSRLMKESSDFLPRLGTAAEKVFVRFDQWTQRIANDGSFDKWVDSGLNAMTSLATSVGNIASIVSSVGEAFSEVAGYEGGFLTTIERATSKLKDFLDSGQGKNTLRDWFERARDLIGDVGKALAEVKPFLSDMADMAREWSTWVLAVVGGLATAAGWIEENTGLMKILLGYYLTTKTVKPFFDAMQTGWQKYNHAVQTAVNSHHSPAWLKSNSFLQWTANQANIAKGNVDALKSSLQAAQGAAATTAATAATATAAAAAPGGAMGAAVSAARAYQPTPTTGPGGVFTAAAMAAQKAERDRIANRTWTAGDYGRAAAAERESRAAAGLGLSAIPLSQRMADGRAAYDARNNPQPVASPLVSASQREADRRARAGIGLLNPEGRASGNALYAQRQEERRAARAEFDAQRARDAAQMRRFMDPEGHARANMAQGQYLGLHPDARRDLRWRLPGQSPAPAMGRVHGPSVPRDMLAARKTPAPGALRNSPMYGPQLPPETLREMASAADDASKKTQDLGNKSKTAAPQAAKLGTEAQSAAPKVRNVGTAASAAAPAVEALGRNSGSAAPSVTSVGNESTKAAPKVSQLGDAAGGTAGQVGTGTGSVGLWGRMVGFAGSLGPIAGGIVAVGGIMWAIDKLGEAHRNAARDAKAQEDALKSLAGTLDSVTGAFTRQTFADTVKELSSYNVAGFGDVNINGALARLGINPGVAATLAADPTKGAAFDAQQMRIEDVVLRDLQGSPEWQRLKGLYAEHGLDERTVAKALIADPAAKAKFDAVMSKPQETRQGTDANGVPINMANLTDLALSLPNKDALQAGVALRGVREENAATGATNLAVTQAATGRQMLHGEGMALMPFEPDLNSVSIDPATGDGRVRLNKPLDPATAQRLKDAGITVGEWFADAQNLVIPAGQVPQYMQGQFGGSFFRGGLVPGEGGPTQDNILARVSPGEHIARAAAVKYYGSGLFEKLNNMELPRFNVGGWPMLPLTPAPPSPFFGGGASVSPVAPPAAPAAPAPTPAPVDAPVDVPGPVAYPSGVNVIDGVPTPAITPEVNSLATAGLGFVPQLGAGFTPTPYGLTADQAAAGEFPSWVQALGQRFGVKPSTYGDHQVFNGLNKGIDWVPDGYSWDSPEGAAIMERFSNYLNQVPGSGVEQIIFENALSGARVGKDPGDRGANQSIDDYYRDDWAGHRNHVHTRFGSSVPLPEQLAGLMYPGLAAQYPNGLPGGVTLGQLTGDGSTGDPLQDVFKKWQNFFNPENMINNVKGAYAKAWDPANAMEFLGGQASNVGSALLGIGTQFLSGITGINFDAILGPTQQVGNHVMGMLGGEQGGSGGSNLLSGMGNLVGDGGAGTYLNQMLFGNGQLALDPTQAGAAGPGGDFNPNLMKQVFPALYGPGKKGGNAYRPMIRQALQKYGPMLGITNMKAWEDALVRQIDTESGGDPFALNGNDSNGKGGRQTVSGVLQFLNTTYDEHNVTGLPQNDPYGQIAAALPYVVKRWGIREDGSPKQIGQGEGFAKGGMPAKDLAWLSSGEFRTNPAATAFYGPGLFDALNSMSIPRDKIKGFAGGGFPLPLAPLQNAAAAAGQSAGPMPLGNNAPSVGQPQPSPLAGLASAASAVSMPSTGGAPGPGATAPAPNPGALPGVQDALTNIGGLGAAIGAGKSAAGAAQPGAAASQGSDARATLGAAPTQSSHVHPALATGIQGAASTIGSLASQAASMGINMVAPGAGSAAGAGIQAGAQMIGGLITGGANILSSLLVGTATNGSTANASGVPMLPAQQQNTGVRPNVQGRVHNGDNHYHLTNLNEFKRQQQTTLAQESMPFIGKY